MKTVFLGIRISRTFGSNFVIYLDDNSCSDCERNSTVDDVHICLDCPKWLCSECKSHHQRVKSTRSHQLYSPPSVSATICQEHFENFTLFCRQCQSLVCLQCICQSHNKHEIMDIAEKEKETQQNLAELAERLESQKKMADDKLIEISQRSQELQDFETSAKLKIQSRFAALHKLLHTLEENVLKDLDRIVAESSGQLAEKRQGVENEREFLLKGGESISNCGKRNRVGLINTFPLTQSLVQSASLTEITRPVEISGPTLNENYLSSENFISDAEKYIIRGAKSGVMRMVENPVIINQVGVKSANDRQENVLYDFAWLGDNRIVVLDNRNKSVKLIDHGGVKKEVYHHNAVCRVCSNKDFTSILVCDEKYVLFHYSNQLDFMNVVDIPMNIRKPYGLEFLGNGNLLIGDRHDGQIYEASLKNDWLTVLRRISSGFSCLDYLTSDGECILVTHGNGNVARVVNFSGETVCEIGLNGSALNWPLGVAIDVHGNYVISDSCNHRILVTNKAGQHIKEIKGFYLPRAVRFSDSNEILIVAERGGRIKMLTYMENLN